MGKLTGTRHGDAANDLLAFYGDKVRELEESGQYFIAAVALGFALETAVLTYLWSNSLKIMAANSEYRTRLICRS